MLSIITTSAQEIKTLKSHPLKSASLETKISYLNVLSLLHDEIIVSSNYLTILLNAVDIDPSMKQDFVDFAKNPDKETIISFFKEFRESDLVIPFLSDGLMLCACEDELEEQSIKVINKLAVELGVYGDKLSDLYDEFSLIKKHYFDDVDDKSIALHVVSYFKFESKKLEVQQKSECEFREFNIIVPRGIKGPVIWNKENNEPFKKGDILAWIKDGKKMPKIIAPDDGILHQLVELGSYCNGNKADVIGQYF